MKAYEVQSSFRARANHPAGLRGKLNRVLVGFLLLTLAGVFGLRAQDANAPGPTNEVTQSEEMSATDAALSADQEETNTVAETNQPGIPGPDARERRLLRQRRARPPGSNRAPGDSAGTNGVSSALDYAAFRMVADRNIFDPNRTPRSNNTFTRPKTVDSFTLVGTMSYEKGIFAFFDGTGSDFKKVLKPEDSIAGYKVVAISPETVKLMLNTNVLELAVGSQMRRRDDGVWERSTEPASYGNAPSSAPQTDAAPSGAESDIIKKMMQRREKE
jgi:hypothetical protein